MLLGRCPGKKEEGRLLGLVIKVDFCLVWGEMGKAALSNSLSECGQTMNTCEAPGSTHQSEVHLMLGSLHQLPTKSNISLSDNVCVQM